MLKGWDIRQNNHSPIFTNKRFVCNVFGVLQHAEEHMRQVRCRSNEYTESSTLGKYHCCWKVGTSFHAQTRLSIDVSVMMLLYASLISECLSLLLSPLKLVVEPGVSSGTQQRKGVWISSLLVCMMASKF